VLQCVAVCCSVLQCVAACCSVLQCVAVRYSVLQCVAVCCSVLQCVAVCCSVLLQWQTAGAYQVVIVYFTSVISGCMLSNLTTSYVLCSTTHFTTCYVFCPYWFSSFARSVQGSTCLFHEHNKRKCKHSIIICGQIESNFTTEFATEFTTLCSYWCSIFARSVRSSNCLFHQHNKWIHRTTFYYKSNF